MLPNGLDVGEDEIVVNSVPKFFEVNIFFEKTAVQTIIKNRHLFSQKQLGGVLNSTSKRTIANYFMWRVVLTTSGTLNDQLRRRKLEYYKAVYGLQGEEERWKECVTYTSVRYLVYSLNFIDKRTYKYFH